MDPIEPRGQGFLWLHVTHRTSSSMCHSSNHDIKSDYAA